MEKRPLNIEASDRHPKLLLSSGHRHEKGKGVGYGELIAHVKEAVEKHEGGSAIAGPLANVRVKRVTA
jgi:hypothetical protein